MDWSATEVKIIVDDYFAMLMKELIDQAYSKTNHRKSILPYLNSRSEGSIEFKHQNISAVLIEMGLPFLRGYKPKFNYQQLLIKEITDHLEKNQPLLEVEFEQFAKESGTINEQDSFDFQHFLSDEPVHSMIGGNHPLFKPIKINFLEREQNNMALGEKGERLIIEYEKWRLIQEGKDSLADKIEWVSKEQGDGTGFDILSKNANGTDRYIEVKTTKLSKETPIYLTSNELSFAAYREKDFFLYRVFNFNSSPKFFLRNGRYESFSILKPETYKAYFS
jgi:hypothetical protein